MTLCFIYWGNYDGFKDTLACAKARAACPIWVISDGPAPAGVNHLKLSTFPVADSIRNLITPNAGEWAAYSLSRWFVLRDFAANHPHLFPIFCADWDVLIFRDLAKAYAPFLQYDYTVSVHEGMESAAYGINRMEPLDAFCKLVEKLNVENDPRAKSLNDMEAWSLNRREHGWNVGDLFQVQNGTVFDHSMHCGEKDYEFEGPAKRLKWDNGFPYFTLKSGEKIAANTIHAWGGYKTKTGFVRRAAGIEL
jgi:hypothetical protein